MANARQRMQARKAAEAKRKKTIRIVIIVVVILAVIGGVIGGVALFQSSQGGEPSGTTPTTPPNATSAEDGIMVNKATGVPVVEMYFDYQCPFCGQVERAIGPELGKLAAENKIQLINHARIFLDTNLRNYSSRPAAIGAACADFAGEYLEYHEKVFANQPPKEGDGYPEELLRVTIPTELGLSGQALTDFQKCYDEKTTDPFVQKVEDEALKNGHNGTPEIFVNGNQLNWNQAMATNPADLLALIESVA